MMEQRLFLARIEKYIQLKGPLGKNGTEKHAFLSLSCLSLLQHPGGSAKQQALKVAASREVDRVINFEEAPDALKWHNKLVDDHGSAFALFTF